MKEHSLLDKLDLHLIRVLHTVLAERSVSQAAIRLGMHQPAVSAALKRLREMAGDPLLVRSGPGMVPTDVGLRMIEPAAGILRATEVLFSEARAFDPARARVTFRLAAADYLDPRFLPRLVSRLKLGAPLCSIEIYPLAADSDYHVKLLHGELDLVVGNWQQPPEDLHMARLFGDDIACLVSTGHPAARRGWDIGGWLVADHIAPTPMHPGARGVIDQMLDTMGLKRNIVARCAHFSLIPEMVASSLLMLTTGRQYCERFVDLLPVTIVECPVKLPRLMYYQLWHERTNCSNSARWLRDLVKSVAASLRPPVTAPLAGTCAGTQAGTHAAMQAGSRSTSIAGSTAGSAAAAALGSTPGAPGAQPPSAMKRAYPDARNPQAGHWPQP